MKTFFFGDQSILAEKRSEFASIQLKPNENSGQVRLRLNQASKKAPPPLCEILATRLFPAIQTIIVILISRSHF